MKASLSMFVLGKNEILSLNGIVLVEFVQYKLDHLKIPVS